MVGGLSFPDILVSIWIIKRSTRTVSVCRLHLVQCWYKMRLVIADFKLSLIQTNQLSPNGNRLGLNCRFMTRLVVVIAMVPCCLLGTPLWGGDFSPPYSARTVLVIAVAAFLVVSVLSFILSFSVHSIIVATQLYMCVLRLFSKPCHCRLFRGTYYIHIPLVPELLSNRSMFVLIENFVLASIT